MRENVGLCCTETWIGRGPAAGRGGARRAEMPTAGIRMEARPRPPRRGPGPAEAEASEFTQSQSQPEPTTAHPDETDTPPEPPASPRQRLGPPAAWPRPASLVSQAAVSLRASSVRRGSEPGCDRRASQSRSGRGRLEPDQAEGLDRGGQGSHADGARPPRALVPRPRGGRPAAGPCHTRSRRPSPATTHLLS